MVLDAMELGVIALIGIGVFIWGPEKVPEIARQIASARRQVDDYTKQLQGITKEIQNSMSTGNIDNLGNVLTGVGGPIAGNPSAEEIARASAGTAGVPVSRLPVSPPAHSPSVPSSIVKSGDQLLLEMARKLGISTQGKTRDDIQQEILSRAAAQTDQPAVAPAEPPAMVPSAGAPAA